MLAFLQEQWIDNHKQWIAKVLVILWKVEMPLFSKWDNKVLASQIAKYFSAVSLKLCILFENLEIVLWFTVWNTYSINTYFEENLRATALQKQGPDTY